MRVVTTENQAKVMKMHTIKIKRKTVNPITGMSSNRISAKDVEILLSLPEFEVSKVRGSRGVRRDGSLWFTCGGGYDVIDKDLCGGNKREIELTHNISFQLI